MMTNEEKLELAKKCGAKVVYEGAQYTIFFESQLDLFSYTSAIEEKYQAQIAIAVNLLKDAAEPSATQEKADIAMCAQWDVDALEFIFATQATAEAFRAEVEARALEEAANVAYAWPDDQHAELELRCMAAEKRKQAEQLTNKEKEA